jgi:haloacetate dehalogenase
VINTEPFESFQMVHLTGAGGQLRGRVGGSGPPVLLVHGYPQTHWAWSLVAPRLAECFTVVALDLPGYGDSDAPEVDREASAYSKRSMAAGLRAAMAELGFPRFALVGHDRGARAAYRLALDHPECVDRLAALSILPTYTMWRKLADPSYAMKAFRWYFLSQPEPLPQRMLAAAGVPHLHATLAGWTKNRSLAPFPAAALRSYEAAFRKTECTAAACADYRAGWTLDRRHDEADLASGRHLGCPLLLIWGLNEFPDRCEMQSAWAEIAPHIEMMPLDCGHFVAEEAPDETFMALAGFLAGQQEPSSTVTK